MIPKVIHYCWFGHNPIPEKMKTCINSWKKFCPDYEIVEWNEANFNIDICSYTREAYAAKKWAFVTDYARLWIIYNYGGIYLDTDVELIKPLDSLLKEHAFFGFENEGDPKKIFIATGLGFGAESHNRIVEKMLAAYDNVHFLLMEGTYDELPCPVRNTKAITDLIPPGTTNMDTVRLKDGVIYPVDYFCPLDSFGERLNKTDNTYSIHWFMASWLSYEEAVVHQYRLFVNKWSTRIGMKPALYLARLKYHFEPQKWIIIKNYKKGFTADCLAEED